MIAAIGFYRSRKLHKCIVKSISLFFIARSLQFDIEVFLPIGTRDLDALP